ncbi:MAG: hypothetical protein M1814_006210 [Vezdaea aestivalis]|nr:MAG: hypothetical protein M1814_006210 [Vezdaea aestivalis]
MFLFNRSASSRDTRQSFKDPASPPTRPSTANRTDTPSSMTSSSDGMSILLDHRNPRPDSRRRSSVFRSRSSSKTLAEEDLDELASLSEILAEQPSNKPKWFQSKSKKHKSKNSLPELSTYRFVEQQIAQPVVRPDVPRLHTDGHRHGGRNAAAIALNNCKRTISRPYNFQHVTHTDSRAFPNLDRTSPNELASEFSAVRASQLPNREVRGFTVQSISRKRPRVSNRSSSSASDNGFNTFLSDTSSPAESQHTITPALSPRNSLAVVPPPRTSSRQAQTLSYETEHAQATPHASGSIDCMLFRTRTPSPEDDSTPHAVTTPDDSAWPLKAPVFGSAGPGLADVPEEEEGSNSRRNSLQNLRQTQSLGDMQAMLNAFDTEAPATALQPPTRPRSAVGDSPYLPSEPRHVENPERFSLGFRSSEACWEDDIDYCYDHALEADCDYDWDRFSDDNDRDNASVSAFGENAVLESRPSASKPTEWSDDARAFRPSLLVPTYTPGVDPPSAVSTKSISTASDSIQTPTSSRAFQYSRPISYASTVFKESDGFTLSPSLLIPADFKDQLLSQSSYEEIIGSDKNPYPMFEAVEIPRSPLSQSASQESMVPSRNSSLARHRPSNSDGSLPELVPSRTVREEFDNAASQLADHIAALNTDSTPSEIMRSRSQHQRTRSLAKDVVNQAILRKAASSGNVFDKILAAPIPGPLSSPLSPLTDKPCPTVSPSATPQRRSSSRQSDSNTTTTTLLAPSSSPSSGNTSPSVPIRRSSKRRSPPCTESQTSRIPFHIAPTRPAPRSPKTELASSRIPMLARKRSNSDAEVLGSWAAQTSAMPKTHGRAASSAVALPRANYNLFPST